MRYPLWTREKSLASLSEERLTELRQEAEECEAENKADIADRRAKFAEMKRLCVEVFGKSHLVTRYLERQTTPHQHQYYVRDFDHRLQQEREKIQKEERERKLQAASMQYRTEAILWLQSKGKVLGTDFTLENASVEADNLAREEAINTRIAEASELQGRGEYHCDCQDCESWDGVSHRCNCGNRRVCWSVNGGFKDPYVYGEVY